VTRASLREYAAVQRQRYQQAPRSEKPVMRPLGAPVCALLDGVWAAAPAALMVRPPPSAIIPRSKARRPIRPARKSSHTEDLRFSGSIAFTSASSKLSGEAYARADVGSNGF
jgi:hypothetical protein